MMVTNMQQKNKNMFDLVNESDPERNYVSWVFMYFCVQASFKKRLPMKA